VTEEEWLAATDPIPMLGCLGGEPSDRKLRLFACTCYRLIPGFLEPGGYRDALELTEKDIESPVEQEAIDQLRVQRGMWWYRRSGLAEANAAMDTYWLDLRGLEWLELCSDETRETLERERASGPLAVRMREVFGNPYRPTVFDSSWRTDTVLSLATQMYESRDFSTMPSMADALQDAGCENADILDHCRGAGPHVRGCWVVDLVLGKE
jgi:hypothetical protein